MSDSEIGEEIPTAELSAVAVFPDGSGYAFTLMDRDGELTAYRLSANKLHQLRVIIDRADAGQPSGSLSDF